MMSDPRLRKLVALLQLLGGSLGLHLAWQLFRMSDRLGLWLPFLVVLVFSFITLAGVFLWRGEKHAETLTALAQGVQLPMILSPAVGYYCIAGIGLQLKAEGLWDWGFYFHLGSMFHVSWGGHPITVLGINIVPVLVLFWLIKQPDTSAVTPSSTVGAV